VLVSYIVVNFIVKSLYFPHSYGGHGCSALSSSLLEMRTWNKEERAMKIWSYIEFSFFYGIIRWV